MIFILLLVAIVYFTLLILYGFVPAFLFLLLSFVLYRFSKNKAKKIEDSYGISYNPEDVLSCPNSDYSYYTIVGMQYRDLNHHDIGIHQMAMAVAEKNNPHDQFAVGIYRDDIAHKLVGYIPKTDNKYLHQYLTNNCHGSAHASYKIWIDDGGNYHGFVFIKDDKFYQR